MPHRVRAVHRAAHPVHVTLRVVEAVPNLRARRMFEVVKAALDAGATREGFRLIEYSVQTNHLHLIVEASSTETLSRGMQGLSIRIARQVNKTVGRRGRVFAGRYHARELKTPREVRNALAYVLLNHHKHQTEAGRRPSRTTIDLCSSGRWFPGWKRNVLIEPEISELPGPRTFLLRVLWRRHGLIGLDEIPGPPLKQDLPHRKRRRTPTVPLKKRGR